jgi:hypothetical protein
MKRIWIACWLLLYGAAFGQNGNQEAAKIKYANGGERLLNTLGYTRIVLKDGSIKKDCLLKEIKANGLVYLKDKVLHDMAIDKIKRIEIEDSGTAIFFDEHNKPLIRFYSD